MMPWLNHRPIYPIPCPSFPPRHVVRYDAAFGPESRQDEVYKCVEDCAKRVLEGKSLGSHHEYERVYGVDVSRRVPRGDHPLGCPRSLIQHLYQ